MKQIKINLSERGYNVYIGYGLINDIKSILKLDKKRKIIVITDNNVAGLYLNNFIKYFEEFDIFSIIIEPGEESKSIGTLTNIYSKMIENQCDRDSIVIGFGGGVVGDISGLAAATYMRGIDLIQIPTTLLAQVDSSVGGKVAINYGEHKNIIGTFYQPKSVLIDVSLLKTLHKRDFNSGMAEVIKCGLIKNYELIRWIYDNFNRVYRLDKEVLEKLVYESLMIKKQVVEKDEKDNDIRKILNFGHTIGHAIESLGNFKEYRHGEAVALGIMYECHIALNLGLISKDYYEEIIQILKEIVEPRNFTEIEIHYIIDMLTLDKKAKKGKTVMILPVERGKVDIFEDLDKETIYRSFKDGLK